MSTPRDIKETPEVGGNLPEGNNPNHYKEEQIDNKDTDSASAKASVAEKLMKIALEEYDLHRAQDSTVFLTSKFSPRHLGISLGDTADELEAELADAFFSREGKVVSDSALRGCLKALRGAARKLSPEPLYLRVGYEAGVIWVDLGRPEGEVVRICGGSWAVQDSADICFRRTPLTAELPLPASSGSLDDLWAFMNVSVKDHDLLIGCLVAAFIPDMAHPIPVMSGEQGTGKSTNARMILDLIDPSSVGLRSIPKQDDWVITASNAWAIGIDNISKISDWLSDALCRAVTGDGDVRRKLYTNGGISVISIRRVIVLTGIDFGELRGDLAERIVSIKLSRISSKKRRDEDDLQKKWMKARPGIFRELLDLVAIAADTADTVDIEDLPRMAKFAKILRALDIHRGTDSLGRYYEQLHELSETILSSNPFIEELRARVTSFHGTSKELLTKLDGYKEHIRPPRGWPQKASEVTEILKRFAPALREAGWTVEDEGNRNQLKTIRWRIDSPTALAEESVIPAIEGPPVSSWGKNTVTVGELLAQADTLTGTTGATGTKSPNTKSPPKLSAELAERIKQGIAT